MNAVALLAELERAGIRLGHDGCELFADVLPGADLAPYRASIAERKPTLVAVLALQEQIVAAASVVPEQFDREDYDRVWAQWSALEKEA